MGLIHTPKLSIPVIDISPQNPNAPAQLLAAAERYGFVFIENNEVGIPPSDISQIFELSRTFFASPEDLKQEVSISSNKAGKNHGWLGRGVETLDPGIQKRPDVKEALNIGEHINGSLQQPIPQPLQPHTETLITFQNACHDLCNKLFSHFSRALVTPSDWFTSRHDRRLGSSGTLLRLLYYPSVPDVEEGVDIRAGAHSDYGSVTLLFQQPGQPGLEILTPGGEWAAVPVDPVGRDESAGDALPILVNFGDLLQDWTGGLFKSTVHRVVFPKGEQSDRYSIAYFCHPLDDAELEPVPSRRVREYAEKTGKRSVRDGKVLTARDHLMERLASTYSVQGKG